MELLVKELDAATGLEIEREMSADELKQWETDTKQIEDKLLAEQAEATRKAADKAALLTKLGITEEEAQLLLGGN
jgi:hypothetical protein